MISNPLFASQTSSTDKVPTDPADAEYGYTVLIIDDEVEVHKVTDLTLKRFRFDGKRIRFLHAYSAREALQIFADNEDIALALVDVVMETDHAGLDLVHKVRNELGNHLVRLVLRTGQPGQAPEHEVIERYDINDYKEKTELTSQKLKTLMYSGLRSFRDIQTIESHRKGLRQVIESTSKMLKPNSMSAFATAVLEEIMNLLQLDSSAVYCTTFSDQGVNGQRRIMAATGSMADVIAEDDSEGLPESVQRLFDKALQEGRSLYSEEGYVFYTETESGYQSLLYVDTNGKLTDAQQELLDIYCFNVALTYASLLKGEEILDTQRELVYLLGDAVEMRSKETGAHVKRVSLVSYRLAQLYGLSEEECLLIKRASPLHDFGKVAIPDRILHKPGKLDLEEWETMKTHAAVGHDILRKSTKPILKVAATICMTHHERWNGKGYPLGLKGMDIPIAGRVAALADVFDALGSKRCYKEPWAKEAIREEILKEKGEHFEPRLVDLLLDNFEDFWEIRSRYPDQGRALMSTERLEWTYEWAGLIRSHTESTTLLQYAVDALQQQLPENSMCTLWVLSTNSADWVPIVIGRNNPLQEKPWRSPKAATREYIEQLTADHNIQLCSNAASYRHALLASRETLSIPWIHHWWGGCGEDYIGVLELGGEEPGGNKQELIRQMVETLMPTICRITQSPLFSVETFSKAPLPQTKTYEDLAEEERLMSLGRLVASVTHEINSPLGVAITGVSHFNESLDELNKHFSSGKLTESFFRHFVEESQDVADLLAFNLQRAVKLIGDFKANAVNQGADQAVRFELESVLNSTTNSLLPELRRYGIELKVGKIPHCVLWSFPGALSQIITNLVFNSINHAFTGIDNKQITLYSEIDSHSEALKLIYRDNGIGIPKTDQQAVFEPYFTTRREAGGSGLGLSIVKALATNKLKGDLAFKSAPQKGVEFAFTLPLDIRANSP